MKRLIILCVTLVTIGLSLCPYYITPATVLGIWPEPEGMMVYYEFPNGEGYVGDCPPRISENDPAILLVAENGPDIYDDRLVLAVHGGGIFKYVNCVQ